MREHEIHRAKVCIAQARFRRMNCLPDRGFRFVLLAWAAKARRNAMAMREPVQGSLL